jgi:hypothetical protein
MQTATEIDRISIEFKKYAPKGFILDANNGGLSCLDSGVRCTVLPELFSAPHNPQ